MTDHGQPTYDHARRLQVSSDEGATWQWLHEDANEQPTIRAALANPEHSTLLATEAGLKLSDGRSIRYRIAA